MKQSSSIQHMQEIYKDLLFGPLLTVWNKIVSAVNHLPYDFSLPNTRIISLWGQNEIAPLPNPIGPQLYWFLVLKMKCRLLHFSSASIFKVRLCHSKLLKMLQNSLIYFVCAHSIDWFEWDSLCSLIYFYLNWFESLVYPFSVGNLFRRQIDDINCFYSFFWRTLVF